jgi:Uma2 family endonuclease
MNIAQNIPVTSLSQKRVQVPIVSVVQRRTKGRMMSLASYMNWKPEDGFKYEWNDGILEQRGMIKPEEFRIVRNLRRAFANTEAFAQGGDVYTEFGCFTSPVQVRVPDISYYTAEQIERAHNAPPVLAFVVEIISPNDAGERTQSKVQEYLRAGVSVIWQVYQQLRQVWVFRDTKHVEICSDDDVCSASPIIPDLRITASELFA